MEGSSSSSNSGGQGLPIPPVDEDPHIGDVPNQDRVEQRRAANREYSQRYRLRQQVHVRKLERQEQTLEEEISGNSPELKYYKEIESDLVDEHNSLQEMFSEAASELQAQNVEADKITHELEQLKLIKKAQQARISEIVSNKNNEPPKGPC